MLRRTLSTLTANAVVFILGLINNVLIARVLGPGVLGNYFLIVTGTGVIANIANLGFNVSGGIMVAKDKSRSAALCFHSILYSVAVGAIVVAAFHVGKGALSAFVFKGLDEELILLAILPVPISIFASNWSALLVGLGEISFLNTYSAVTSFLSLGISAVSLLVFGAGLKELLVVLLIYNALLAVYGIRAMSRMSGGIRPRVDATLLKDSARLGFVAHMGNVAHLLFQRLDFFMVNYFLGEKSLGYYGLATSIAEKIWMMVSPVYTVAFPRITGDSFADSSALVSKITRGLTCLLLILSVVLAASGHFVIRLMFGEQYLPAYVPMVILLPGVLFFGIHFFLGLFFIGHLQRPRVTTAIAWIGLAISIPLYYGFIRSFGINGAALASTVTYTFIFLATFMKYREVAGQSLFDVVVPRAGEIRGISAELRRASGFPEAGSVPAPKSPARVSPGRRDPE